MTELLAFIVSNTRAFIAVDLCTSASFPSLAQACRPDIFIFTSDFVRSHVRPSSDLPRRPKPLFQSEAKCKDSCNRRFCIASF